MPNFDMTEKVMIALNLQGNDYQKDTIEFYIDDVKRYLLAAGVKPEVVESEKAVGAIARGVTDLWSYGAGDGRLSTYFYQRAIQLAKVEGE